MIRILYADDDPNLPDTAQEGEDRIFFPNPVFTKNLTSGKLIAS